MTRRHLGCIGDPSKTTDTDIVHQRPIEVTDRHTVHQ